jgi:hypothetical protein
LGDDDDAKRSYLKKGKREMESKERGKERVCVYELRRGERKEEDKGWWFRPPSSVSWQREESRLRFPIRP